MKVLQIAYSYHPDPVGGVEVYAESLARHLRERGIGSVICAPGARSQRYEHRGIEVRRFPATCGFSLENDYQGDAAAGEAFARILEEERPALVHAHALNSQVFLPLARSVKAMRLPFVFTYHAAAATCELETLLRWGSEPCSGRLHAGRCAACTLHRLGMPRIPAALVAAVPQGFGRAIRDRGWRGPAWTALRMRQMIGGKHASTRAFMALADRVVAPARWVHELLLANGVDAAKIVACAQGIEQEAAPGAAPARRAGETLRLAMVGRLDPRKGIDLLLDAFARAPDLDATLDLYLVEPPKDGREYGEAVARRVAGDRRIRLLPPLAHERVIETLRGYHALAVPSRTAETGPLVVLEAFAAGIPVLGANRPGIAERVADGVDGLLLPSDDAEAWARALSRLAQAPGALERLAQGVRAPRSMGEVAARMADLYEDLMKVPA